MGAEDVFDEVLVDNPLVCQNCYRGLQRTFEISASDVGDVDVQVVDCIAVTSPHPRRPGGHGAPLAQSCWNCDVTETDRSPPTRSKQEAVATAANISATLSEYSIDHDWLVLLGRVKDLKSDPSMAGRDYEVFRLAVAAATEVV